MSDLAKFFKHGSSELGVFYPKDYLIASFRSYSVAQSAAQALLEDGWTSEHVRFVPASELLECLEEIEFTLKGLVMTALSRLIAAAAAKNDAEAERAKLGAGFVAVHCVGEADALRVLETVRPFEPLAMDYYRWDGVESLIAPSQPAKNVAPTPHA